eukprot:Sdes_comp16603_c0_seq1m5911
MGKEKSSKSSKRSAKDSDIDSEATTPLKVAKVQDSENEISYEELVSRVNHISKPLASKKLSKRLLKVVKKGIFPKSPYALFSSLPQLMVPLCLFSCSCQAKMSSSRCQRSCQGSPKGRKRVTTLFCIRFLFFSPLTSLLATLVSL